MAKLPPITERAFQRQVVQLAVALGFVVYHTNDSRRSHKGFPDLVLVRPAGQWRDSRLGRVLFIELKTDTGRLKPEQEQWGRILLAAGADWRLWRPRDWPEIERTLKGG